MAIVPIPKAASLLAEKALTAVGSILSPHRESVADTLTPLRMGNLMREADRGNITAYLTLAEEMEEREPHYASVLGTRKLGVSGSQPTVISPTDSPDDKAICDDLERLVADPLFEGLILDCMDGVPKGFAMVEIIWERSERQWMPIRFEFREQRHFLFDKDTMKRPLLRTEKHYEDGEELQPYKWIQHFPKLRSGIPIRTGLARTVAVTYAAKRWTVADWLSFMDIYGIPIRIGRYPSHLADQKKELLRAVKAIGADAAAVVPKEMEIEFVEGKSGSGGTTLFQQSAEYWDKQTSKVVLGQTMSSDDGASLAQSKTHERVRFDIRDADARSVAATIARDLFKPYVILNYGPRPVYPGLRLNTQKPEDTKMLMDATKTFVNLGGKVQMSEVRDRLGLAEPEEGAELLQPEAAIAAAHAPKPDPNAPPRDELPAQPKPKAKDKPAPELNRSQFSENQGTEDVVDELADAALTDWQPLVEPVVAELFRLLAECTTFEQALAVIESMRADVGDVIEIDKLVASLARETYRVRGIGDATDKTEDV
jgi:phage gp29-like protein